MAGGSSITGSVPLISAGLTLINIIIAVIALRYNNNQAAQRDIRKEFRGRIDDLAKKIEDIEKLGVSFHTSEKYSDDASEEINWKLDRLSKLLQVVGFFSSNTQISSRFINLKRAITLENFNSSKFKKQPHSTNLIKEIHYAATQMIREIEVAFEAKYTNNKGNK